MHLKIRVGAKIKSPSLVSSPESRFITRIVTRVSLPELHHLVSLVRLTSTRSLTACDSSFHHLCTERSNYTNGYIRLFACLSICLFVSLLTYVNLVVDSTIAAQDDPISASHLWYVIAKHVANIHTRICIVLFIFKVK